MKWHGCFVSLPGSYLGIQLVAAAAVPLPVAGQRETAWSLSRHRRTDQQLQLLPLPPPQLPPADCWGCSSRTFSGEPAGRWATWNLFRSCDRCRGARRCGTSGGHERTRLKGNKVWTIKDLFWLDLSPGFFWKFRKKLKPKKTMQILKKTQANHPKTQ